jgi:hypothetical protein
MSASLSLHSADSNSATVRNHKAEIFEGFATLTVSDTEKGADVTLFFANLGEVLNFSLMIQEGVKKALKEKK